MFNPGDCSWSTIYKRVAKPDVQLAKAPGHSIKLWGWWTQRFITRSGVVYERRRRRGRNGVSERWFVVASFEMEEQKPKARVSKSANPAPPTIPTFASRKANDPERYWMLQALDTLLEEIAEELEFRLASEEIHRLDKIVLTRMERRIGDAQMAMTDLIYCPPPLETGFPAHGTKTLQ